MEYREAPDSPSASSATTLEPDGLGSPTTPSSPLAQPIDDERLPNELLDEICEDIGMKEGMELDFVEFLMEQDSTSNTYMAASTTLNNSLSSLSSSSTTTMATAKCSAPRINDGSDSLPGWARSAGVSMPSSLGAGVHSRSSTVTSSGSSSPVAKRFHLSSSGETSPTTTKPPQQLAPPPQQLGPQVFKMPQTPPTPKHPSAAGVNQGPGEVVPPMSSSLSAGSQGTPSKSDSTGMASCPSGASPSGSAASSLPGVASLSGRQQCFSPLMSAGQYGGGIAMTPPKPHAATAMNTPRFAPYTGGKNLAGTLHYGQTHQTSASRMNGLMHRMSTVTNGQRMGKMAPPVVNVKNMRMQSPKLGGVVDHRMGMQMNSPYPQHTNPALDQGFFAKESYPGYDKSSMIKPDDLSSMIPSIHNSVGLPRSAATVNATDLPPTPNIQKSVHFATDMPNTKSECLVETPADFNSGFSSAGSNSGSDQAFNIEHDFRDQPQRSSKIMPRLTPSMKSEVAPYTVPGSSPYDYVGRSSCGVGPSGSGSPVVSVQPFDFVGKDKFDGKPQGDGFFMDSNQNMLRVDSVGDYAQMNFGHQSVYNVSMQQQQQQQQAHMNVYR